MTGDIFCFHTSHLDKFPQLGGMLKNYPMDDWYLTGDNLSIKEGEPGWEEAYKNWSSGKNPTSDPLWKKGVYFQMVEL